MSKYITPDEMLNIYKELGLSGYTQTDMAPIVKTFNLALGKLHTELDAKITALIELNTALIHEINTLKQTPSQPRRTSVGRGVCYCGSTSWENERCVHCGRK